MTTVRVHAGSEALAVPGLAELYADAPVTARLPWLETWALCYGDWEPWVVVVAEEGQPVAAAALARRHRGGLVDVVALGHGPSDCSALPARDAAAASALAAMLADALDQLRTPWRLRLQQLPAGDPVAGRLAGLLDQASLGEGDGMPVVQVTERDLNRYLSKNSRKSLARMRNRLSRAGLEPRYEWTSDAARICELLPDLAQVHRDRDAHLGRRGDHALPATARFHEEIVRRLARTGEVRVLTLWLSGRVAAYALSFADGRTLRVWDNRLAPEWAEYSAGRLANTEVLRHVVEDGEFDVLDWMRGEEPYKLQSATEVLPTATLRAWSSRTTRLPDDALDLARRARDRSPAVRRAVALVRGERQPRQAPSQPR